MKSENATNFMVLDILKDILSMAEKPAELSAFITSKVRELIGCKMVAMIVKNEENLKKGHEVIGIYPERNKEILESSMAGTIADLSAQIHSPQFLHHSKKGTELEKTFSHFGGNHSIIVPLEYNNVRVGILILVDILDVNNIKSVIDTLDVLSGVLALELRNASFLSNLEDKVTNRTKELSESEQRFRTIIEHASDAIFLSDADGNIVDANNQACKSLGYSKEELLQMKINDFDFLISDTEKVQEAFGEILTEGSFRIETFHKHKNGNIFPVEINSSIIELGGITHFVGFARDLTERKKAEDALRLKEEYFRNVFEHAAVGKSITDLDGHLKSNIAFRKMLGYSDIEFVGINWKSITYPDDIEKNQQIIDSILAGECESARWEKRYIHKDGHIIWADITTVLQKDREQNPEYFITTIQDITDRKQSETELMRLLLILESSLNEIYAFNPDNLEFEYVNKAALDNLGYNSEEIKKMTPVDLKPEFTESSFRQAIAPLVNKEQKQLVFSTMHLRKDGSKYPVEVHLQLVSLENQQVFLAIIIDITERKRDQDKLINSELRLRTLLDAIPELIWLKDTEGVYLLCNKRFEYFFGASEGEIIGKTDYYFAEKEMADFFRMKDQETIIAGKPCVNEELVVYPDGHKEMLETIKTPLLGSDGKIVGVLGIGRDITERKRMNADLLLEQMLMKKLIDSLPGIFYMYSYPELRLVRLNKNHETLLGFNEGELHNISIHDFKRHDVKKTLIKAINTVIEKGYVRIETSLYTKNDTRIPFILTGVKIEVASQTYVMGVGIDISEREQAEIQIKEQIKELQRWYEAMLDREDRVLELKQEVNQLLALLGDSLKYEIVGIKNHLTENIMDHKNESEE